MGTTQFFVSLGFQILIAIIGFSYQHKSLRAMNATAPAATMRPAFRYWPLVAMVLCGAFAWAPFVLNDLRPQYTNFVVGWADGLGTVR